MTSLAFIISHWRVALAIGACLAGLGLHHLGKHDGRQQAAVAAAEATAKAIQKRADVDEKIIGMDAVALCRELGGVSDECEQLRGLESDSR